MAFIDLVLERNYANVGVSDIVERANVGRSTFYSHFHHKDELLISSMQWMFAILAEAAIPDRPNQPVRNLAEHFWSNRRLAQAVLSPPIERKLRRELASAIHNHIKTSRTATDVEAGKLRSIGIAAGQLAVLEAWTKGEISVGAETVAETIVNLARQPGRTAFSASGSAAA